MTAFSSWTSSSDIISTWNTGFPLFRCCWCSLRAEFELKFTSVWIHVSGCRPPSIMCPSEDVSPPRAELDEFYLHFNSWRLETKWSHTERISCVTCDLWKALARCEHSVCDSLRHFIVLSREEKFMTASQEVRSLKCSWTPRRALLAAAPLFIVSCSDQALI